MDILAEEVSDVDRAANRRKYLVIKRETEGDEDGLGPEIFDDEHGDEDMDSEPDDASLTKARRSRATADDEESSDSEDEDEDEREDEESQDVDDAEDEEESDDDDDRRRPRRGKARKETRVLSAKAKVTLLRRTAPVLERLTKLVASIKDAAETQEGSAQDMPDWITRELQWVCDALAQLLGQSSKSATRPVNKLGAKMASQRREQFHGAIELLQRLLQEVMPEITASRAPAPNPPQPSPTAKAARREPATHGELGALLASMTEGISALTTQVKTQASELARLKKSTGLPASRPVESARRPRPPAPEGQCPPPAATYRPRSAWALMRLSSRGWHQWRPGGCAGACRHARPRRHGRTSLPARWPLGAPECDDCRERMLGSAIAEHDALPHACLESSRSRLKACPPRGICTPRSTRCRLIPPRASLCQSLRY